MTNRIPGLALCLLLAFTQAAIASDRTFILAQAPIQRPNIPAQLPAQSGPPAQMPIQRPINPRVDQLKEQDPALKACLADNRKLKDRVAGLERDLKDVKAKLAAATTNACLADDVYRDAAGKVRSCGAYVCKLGEGGCARDCIDSTWCSIGYVCETLPRPGRCVPAPGRC